MVLLDFGLVAVGIIALTLGADYLVRGVVTVANRARLSKMLISLTVVAFGTSMPELFIVVESVFSGAPGLGVGNIVGSNIANLCLIMPAAALIRPVGAERAVLRRDGTAMLVATGVFALLAMQGEIGRPAGALSLLLLTGYLIFAWMTNPGETVDDQEELTGGAAVTVLAIVGGLTGLIVGSELLVAGGVSLARDFGVGETVIGLTLVAVGTSLPELATCIAAVIRRQSEIVLGNVLGSNLFNLLGVVGLAGLLAPLPIPEVIQRSDLWVMVALSVLSLVLVRTYLRLDRWEAGLLLTLYILYVTQQYGLIGIPAAWLPANALGH